MFFVQRFPFEHFAFVLAPLAFWWLWKFLWYEAIFFKKIILAFMFFLQRFPFEHFVFVLVALAFWWVWKFLWYEAFYFKKIILAFMFKRLVSVYLNVKNKQKNCVTMCIWRKYFEYEICIIFLIKLGWCWWTFEVWIKKIIDDIYLK